MQIGFMPVQPEHYALLRAWLAEPHMRKWWGDPEVELRFIRDMVEGRDTTRPFLIRTISRRPVAAGILPEAQPMRCAALSPCGIARRPVSEWKTSASASCAASTISSSRSASCCLGAALIFFTGFEPVYCLAAAAFIWALSELLVRRMRLVLPGILLSVLFVFFTYQAIPANQLIHGGQPPYAEGAAICGRCCSA